MSALLVAAYLALMTLVALMVVVFFKWEDES